MNYFFISCHLPVILLEVGVGFGVGCGLWRMIILGQEAGEGRDVGVYMYTAGLHHTTALGQRLQKKGYRHTSHTN